MGDDGGGRPLTGPELDYYFTEPPDPEAMEWPGAPIGRSNVITRTRGRTRRHEKDVDRQPGKLERLLESVRRHRQRNPGQSVWEHDVVIHGVRVRAATNSPHLHQFWVENWFSPQEWQELVGHPAPAEPQVVVHAFGGVADEEEAAYYSRRDSTIVFFNTAYYGQLKSWVLGAVGRVLASEHGIHSVHGACVAKEGKGVLYIAPTGTGKSTSSYGLTDFPQTRFHSDDWVYIRYCFPDRQGRAVAPVRVRWQGEEVRGFRVFRWLQEKAPAWPQAEVQALTLEGRPVSLPAGDLDLQRLEAYAYISEKVFYIRTNLVENFPLAAAEFLRSNLENVPQVTRRFLESHAELLNGLRAQLRASRDPRVAERFRGMADQEVGHLLARLFAFDNGRAMLDIANVLPEEKVYVNPMEPVRLAVAFLLRRDHGTDLVAKPLTEGEFLGSLLVGRTPQGKYETAYNAYRAVVEEEERAFVQALMERSGGDDELLYRLYCEADDVPYSLVEEFELFRLLYGATRSYVLNTILMRDPEVRERGEAVALTMNLMARTIQEPLDRALSLGSYRRVAAELTAGGRPREGGDA